MEPLLFAAVTAIVDILPTTLVGWVSTAVIGCMGWLVKQTYDNDKRLTAHVATDDVMFSQIKGTLTSLKEGQCTDSQKLDRLIEHLMFDNSPRQMPMLQSHLVTSLTDSPRGE